MTKHTLLVVDDNEDIRFALTLLLEQAGYRVIEAQTPAESLQMLTRITPDLILLDMNFQQDTTSGKEGLAALSQLPHKTIPIILMTAWANIELAVQGLQAGAQDFIEKPWRQSKLLEKIALHLEPHIDAAVQVSQWVAESEPMQQLETMIQALAPSDANILILGENGTGKSLLAKRIHQLSKRKEEEFVTINMGAMVDSLFESELFGHRKGAFTDAKQDRLGAFSRANGGSLFMDEIGTLPIHLQPKLLQVLETGEFLPLGAEKQEQVDVRLIAATNQDLQAAIKSNIFRQDLYYRLNTFVVTLPPLRARAQDILPLANGFVVSCCDKYGLPHKSLCGDAAEKLQCHHWPGNVRELQHVIERAVLLCQKDVLTAQDLAFESGESINEVPELPLETLEKLRIKAVLAQYQGEISQSAKILGISRNALYRRLEKYQMKEK